MTAGGGVDVLGIIEWARNFAAKGGLPRSAAALDLAHKAIAELIAADKEYDEARAEMDASPMRDLSRLNRATARRASALAALDGR